MKRFDLMGGAMVEKSLGEFVAHEEAAAQIEQLKAMIQRLLDNPAPTVHVRGPKAHEMADANRLTVIAAKTLLADMAPPRKDGLMTLGEMERQDPMVFSNERCR